MLLVSEREQLPFGKPGPVKPEAWDVLSSATKLPLYAYVFELIHQEQTSPGQSCRKRSSTPPVTLAACATMTIWAPGSSASPTKNASNTGAKPHPEQVPIDPEDEDHPDLDAGPQEILIRKEQEGEFMRLLDELTPPHRAVVLLHFVEDFSLEEIAGITGAQSGP